MMKNIISPRIVLLLILLSVVSCGVTNRNQEKQKPSFDKSNIHWSYDGATSPDNWTKLGIADCGGEYQSPIDIMSLRTKIETDNRLNFNNFHYSLKTKVYSVVNNGHTVQYNFEKGDYLEYKNQHFELKQFHFHSPSEHLINGVRYPLEIHMVHMTENKKILVIAFMVEEGEKNNDFSKLQTFLPISNGQKKDADFNYNFLSYLEKGFKYYHYQGSLTTPPCTEGVDWFVMQNPIILSKKQIKLLQQSMPKDNYRPAQKLNGRVITTND